MLMRDDSALARGAATAPASAVLIPGTLLLLTSP